MIGLGDLETLKLAVFHSDLRLQVNTLLHMSCTENLIVRDT